MSFVTKILRSILQGVLDALRWIALKTLFRQTSREVAAAKQKAAELRAESDKARAEFESLDKQYRNGKTDV